MSRKAIDLYFVSLCLVIITIPFAFLPNNISIVLLMSSWVFLAFQPGFNPFQNIRKNPIAIIMISFGLLYGLSAIVNPGDYRSLLSALRNLEVRAGFVLFPLALSGLSYLPPKSISRLFKIYVSTIVVASAICLLLAAFWTLRSGSVYHINDFNGILENNFTYHRLASWIGIHAVYLAAYVAFAFFIVLITAVKDYSKLRAALKIRNVVLLIYLAIVVFLLKSISISIAFLVILMILIVYYIIFRIKLSFPRLLALFLTIVLILFLFSYRVFDKMAIKESLLEYDMEELPPVANWNPVNLRLAQWEIATQIIRDNWFLGVGPGNLNAVLQDYYERNKFHFALTSHFNPHNQFLQTFIVLGVIGFLFHILLFIVSYRKAFRHHDLIMLVFISTFLLFSVSESIFSVNKGVVFFSFFLSLFSYMPKKG